MAGIYCIENKVNKKKYVGKDRHLNNNRRWYNHVSKLRKNKHSNKHLQNSWNKYGESNFSYYIIEECSLENLDSKEIHYIAFYQSNNNIFGYNMTTGGDGNNGWKPSVETKNKISLSHMGSKNPMFGKKLNEKQLNAVIRYGERNNNFGKHRTKEEKENLREKLSREKSPVFGTKQANSSSKYFGVLLYHQKQTIKGKEYSHIYWISQLRVDKKQYNLGYFKDEISAAKAYDVFVLENNLKNPLNFPKQKYDELENLKI